MSDDRAAKRRARRASGVRATHEHMTVALMKTTAEDMRAEMAALGATVSQAEFAGAVLEMAVHRMRVEREAKAASANLIQPATPAQVQTVYQGQRTPR